MVSQSFAPPVDSSLLFLFTRSHRHCWQASASFKTVVSQGVVLVLKSEPLLPCAMGHAQPHKNAATLPSPAFLAGKREGKLPQPQGNSELKSFLSGKEALIWVTKIKRWRKNRSFHWEHHSAPGLSWEAEGGEPRQKNLCLMANGHYHIHRIPRKVTTNSPTAELSQIHIWSTGPCR